MKKTATDTMPHLHAKPGSMKRTGALQTIVKDTFVGIQNPLTSAEIYTLHEKARQKPIRLDLAGPTRITNSMMPNCNKPLFEVPAHLTPERIEASKSPGSRSASATTPAGGLKNWMAPSFRNRPDESVSPAI